MSDLAGGFFSDTLLKGELSGRDKGRADGFLLLAQQ